MVKLLAHQPDDPLIEVPDEIRNEHAEHLVRILWLIFGAAALWSFPVDFIVYPAEQVLEDLAELSSNLIPGRCSLPTCRLW